MTGRYDVRSSEGEYEPGSDGLVLANQQGITSPEDIGELELQLLGSEQGRVFSGDSDGHGV